MGGSHSLLVHQTSTRNSFKTCMLLFPLRGSMLYVDERPWSSVGDTVLDISHRDAAADCNPNASLIGVPYTIHPYLS